MRRARFFARQIEPYHLGAAVRNAADQAPAFKRAEGLAYPGARHTELAGEFVFGELCARRVLVGRDALAQ